MRKLLWCFLLLSQWCYGQFKAVPPRTDASFRGLSVVDDSVAWVSGTKGWIGRTTDAGKTWKLAQVKGYETSDFRSLYAFDDKTAVIANAGAPAYILYTNDAGQNWKLVYKNDHVFAFFDGIDFWNEKDGIIYGDPIDSRMLLLNTTDGGKNWQEFTTEQRPKLADGEASFAASGSCIKCMDNDKVVIATGGGVSRLWVSEDRGKHWDTITTPILQGQSTRGIFSFAFNNNNQGVIVGGDYKIDTLVTANVFYTNNGGKRWKRPKQPTRGYRECVLYKDDNTLLATGPSGTDISRNGGKNWQPFYDEKQYHVIKKARKGKLVIMAGGGGRIAVME